MTFFERVGVDVGAGVGAEVVVGIVDGSEVRDLVNREVCDCGVERGGLG